MSPPALGTRWRAKPKLTTQRGLLTTISDVDGVATRATAQGASAVLIACVSFVVLTALAMLEYPGGSLNAPGSHKHVFVHSLRHRDDVRRNIDRGLRRIVARDSREPGYPGPHGMVVQVERDRERTLLRGGGADALEPLAHRSQAVRVGRLRSTGAVRRRSPRR